MALIDDLKDIQMKAMNTVHKTILTISGGRLGSRLGNMPVVAVTTTGRTSGLPRTVMLTTPIHEDGRYVLVASKGGDDRHPDWYRNLVAHPEITLKPVDGDGPVTLTARTADAAEKDELWPRIVDAYKGYAGYKEKTDRDIPVVICEPAA
ncbi:MAG: nitroreductase family deazaflavin-dependent oxidoreductase [Ilumatobacter sp.]|uniref:nitroreductase family deazaflavin-dependent oxidoreductase n=1 Tax=Ilumatobacter sp. TaxID=1967498 RepID=UPI003C768608